MKKKIAVALAVTLFAALACIAEAQIKVVLQVKDSGGNVIEGGTVHSNTIVYIHGYYEDLGGNTQASALMQVYRYTDGTAKTLEATLFDGVVDDGATIIKEFRLTKHGTYEFKWDCRKEGATTVYSVMHCRVQRGLDYSTVFVVPEPGTVAGLLMALSALGLFAATKSRVRRR